MVGKQESSYTKYLSGKAFLVCGLMVALSDLPQEATTLLRHIISCLAEELFQATLWVFISICRSLAGHLLNLERIVVCCQHLAALEPLLHCLLLGK